jgi:hypothetical protein
MLKNKGNYFSETVKPFEASNPISLGACQLILGAAPTTF